MCAEVEKAIKSYQASRMFICVISCWSISWSNADVLRDLQKQVNDERSGMRKLP
jgi:hypothetical protein